MKAKFLALAALVLGLASCQTDTVNGVKVDANGEAPVTIQVGLPEEATRAAGNDSALGAIGNIDLDNDWDIRYILEVYDEKGALAKERMVNRETESTSTSFTLRLVPGRGYKFVVWADFIPQSQEGNGDYHYNTNKDNGGLKENITLLREQNAMDESRDAYTEMLHVEKFDSKSNISMTLTRPFAKLRIVTTDMNELYSELTGVTVTYTTDLYSTFNALTETADNIRSVQKVVTFGENTIYAGEPTDDGKMTLYADYFFGAKDNKVHFTMNVTDKTGLDIPQIVFNTDIPVQRNYLTTIYGPVLTDANNVTVTIDARFEGEYFNGSDVDTTESFADALADAAESVEATIDLTGDVVWSTGAGIGSTPWIPEGAKTQKLTVNANGHKITATGSGVGAIRMANGGELIINNAVIVDESVSYAENSWEYGYLEFAGKLQFNECEFVNAIMVEDADATFVGCKFNSNDENQYAVWVSGNNASFENCVVEGPRGIKMHEAYGSEIKKVVINKCQFNNIYKKPGVAMGDLNPDTKVVIKNSTFTNCQAGDQGLYIYETDTDVATFDFAENDNVVINTVTVGAKLDEMLQQNIKSLTIELGADVELNTSDAYLALGGEDTELIVIDGKKLSAAAATGAASDNYKLTLATTYWSRFTTKNPDANVILRNLTLTSSQTTGTWNSYDVTLNCNVELENVDLLKAVAFDGAGKSVKVKDVTIKETHDYYAMWISAKGQTVTVDGLTIESLGRGIKIDEQYVSAPEKVTLNVVDATLKTAKKAAIVVKSVAGAEINVSNIDITNVAADNAFAVWVDEDSAAYADLVTVNGAYAKVEGDNTSVSVSTNDGITKAIANGAETIVLADGAYNMPAVSGKKVTILGSKDVVITVNKPNMSGSDVTFEGVTVKGSGYSTGVQHVNTVTYNNVKVIGEMCLYGEAVTFNNCEFELNNQYIWTYGAKNAAFNNCVFNTNGKAILVYNEGAGANNVTVNGCTFNATAGAKAGAIANQNCAAIEIDNFQGSGVGAAHKVTASDNTYSENFSGEWRIKNFVTGNAITVNGTEYTQIAVDGNLMTIDANKNVTVLE